jgi:hypothetical protein
MSVKNTAEAILKILEKYHEFLTGIDEEQFQKSPAESVWSYSEVYSHIIYTDTRSLMAIEKSIHNGLPGRMQLRTWLILSFGKFPPVKIKAPQKIGAMVQKISTEEARNGIIKLRERVLGIIDVVEKSSPDQKIRHPRLGLLNAKQWLRFIEVHSLHHLKQLQRINLMLSNN